MAVVEEAAEDREAETEEAVDVEEVVVVVVPTCTVGETGAQLVVEVLSRDGVCGDAHASWSLFVATATADGICCRSTFNSECEMDT